MPSKIVVALGGNALQKQGEASAHAQQDVADETARQLVPLILAGYQLVIVHGNGPQVGNIVLHEEAINTPEVPTGRPACTRQARTSPACCQEQARPGRRQ